ncbi:hypothetical protein QYF36_017485 [Acer negundo]|nr:hypothetical protein QYF36_017485 [Acer negundo]
MVDTMILKLYLKWLLISSWRFSTDSQLWRLHSMHFVHNMALTPSAIAKLMLQSQDGFGCVSDKHDAIKFPPSMPLYEPPEIKPKLGSRLDHGRSFLEKEGD